MLVKLLFFLHFILLDPDPQTEMNADPTGSGSTSLVCRYLGDHRFSIFHHLVILFDLNLDLNMGFLSGLVDV